MNFICPKCGENRLEEVLKNVTQYIEISDIDNDGYPVYDDNYCDKGEISHFQCYDCGEVLVDSNGSNIECQDKLVEWLEDQELTRLQDEKRGTYPDKADIAN